MALISPSHRQQLSEGAVPLSKSVNLSTNPSRWLVSSPYLGSDHLLDLETVDRQSRLFAIALTNLSPATENYAAVNYEKAFDFDELMASLRSVAAAEGVQWRRQVFYVVEFRSKLRVEIDNDLLYSLDKMSHAEATQSGGLLKYWYGVPDGDRRNLATCFWTGKDDAVKGGQGPWHKQARAIIAQMYEKINIKGMQFTIEDDAQSWHLTPYS